METELSRIKTTEKKTKEGPDKIGDQEISKVT
jgi:hypothetical protein